MKKTLNYMVAAALLLSPLALTACSDTSTIVGEGTTTGGLDIGAASTRAGSDTTMTTSGDTVDTATGATIK